MNYTTVEQSKKLLELGLNPETADMWYQHTGISIKDGSQKSIYFPMVIRDSESDKDIPCWSVGALMNIMPRDLYMATPRRKEKFIIETDTGWAVYYRQFGDKVKEKYYHWVDGNTLIDACFEMVVWLLENGHIQKGE